MDLTRIVVAALLVAMCANAMPSSIALSSSTSGSILGQSVTLTATVTPQGGTGKITFYDGVLVLGIARMAGGQAVLSTCVLPFGAHSLTAYYGGDANLAASRSAAISLTVNAGAANGFQAPANISVGMSPAVAAVDDFNGDGFADLVIVNRTSSTLSILLGNGDGTFHAATSYVSQAVFTVATGDFNGDGKRDLVISNSGQSSVSVLLGNGDGTFKAGINYLYSASAQPCCLAVGDFNGDGKPDLVVANTGNSTTSVLLGNGDGTFQPAVTSGAVNTTAPGRPDSVAVSDFNGDGMSDIVMTQNFTNKVSVLLGNGDGTFQPAVNYAAGNEPFDAVVGDFNGDGRADFAVTNTGDNTVSMFLGLGDGTFQPAMIYPAGHFPLGAAAGDFNGDGKTDLAVTNELVNSVSILLGRFATATTTTLESSPNPSNFGQTVTLTAMVSPASATGSVAFYDGGTVLGNAMLSGGRASITTLSLGSGTPSLTVAYAGDATNMASTSRATGDILQNAEQ